MTYDITDAEKAQAEKALLTFNICLKLLTIALDHLNIMAVPFKDHPDISSEQLIKFRAALRRYRDKCIENFNTFKIAAFKCITLMQPFSNDTQTAKLLKSFISSIEDIEKQVNVFADLFNNLKSKDFVTQAVQKMETIKKEVNQLEEIIDDRIKSHIQTDILGKSWVNDISNELEMKIERKTPLLIDLDRERQNELNSLEEGKNRT
jgi:uncharacterized protein (UPF0335 family)